MPAAEQASAGLGGVKAEPWAERGLERLDQGVPALVPVLLPVPVLLEKDGRLERWEEALEASAGG
jgi:hypothetical protein